MEFKKEIIVKKPIDGVWEVLGDQFGEAHRWASGLYHSSGSGPATFAGANCSLRSCDTNLGKIKERMAAFDPQAHILSYEVIEGFPFFVDTGINTWTLTKQGQHTLVQVHLVIKTKGIMGSIMGPMMKLQMGGILTNVLDDFKQYNETGRPSARKAKELAKAARKAA